MTRYKRRLSDTPTFSQRGLQGFQLPLPAIEGTEVYLVRSERGHDDVVKSDTITHAYLILEGSGVFEVDGERFECGVHDVIEIPPAHEFTYTGRMQLLLLLSPPFRPGAVTSVRPNLL